jgi:hypothetical protein
MKTFTNVWVAMLLLIGMNVSAQVRWNPSDWNGVPDATNKISVMTPGQVGDDATRVRGDYKLLADIKFTDEEPFFAFMLTTDDCKLDLLDWKLQFMCQRHVAVGTQDAEGNWSYGPWEGVEFPNFDTNKKRFHTEWGAEAYELVGYENDLLEGESVFSGGRHCVWIVDLESPLLVDGDFLIDGSFDLPFLNPFAPVTEDGQKLEAMVDGPEIYRQRSWVETVTMAREAVATKAKFNLHYAATVEYEVQALELIDAYKAGSGGREVREWDDTAVSQNHANTLKVWQNNNRIIAPSATRIEAYSVTGSLVTSVNDSELTLTPGLYIIKALRDQGSVTTKVIIK